MYDESAVYLVRDALFLVLLISAPMLIIAIVIGLTISLIQSVTSIQDQTLTFVPKITGMVVIAAMLLPWISMKLVEFAQELFQLF